MKTILIVEDIDLNVDLLTQILEEEYNILIAKDGAQAVTLTEKSKPDLILMVMKPRAASARLLNHCLLSVSPRMRCKATRNKRSLPVAPITSPSLSTKISCARN